MKLVRGPLLGITLALMVAGPAAGFRGTRLTASLRPAAATVSTTKTETAHTCQAGTRHSKTRSPVVGDARNPAVVACEQPPRSGLSPPSLKQTAPNAVTAIG
jgi:hypothetical protein